MPELSPALLAGGAAVTLLLAGLLLMGGDSSRKLKERVAGPGRGPAAKAERQPATLTAARITDRRGPGRFVYNLFGYEPMAGYASGTTPVLIVLTGLVAGFLVGLQSRALAGMPLAAVIGVAAALLLPRFLFSRLRANHRNRLFEQLPDAVAQIVRAVRAGLPVGEALRSVAREMPAPTSSEFSRVVAETAVGVPVEDALRRLYDRTAIAEYGFLAVTLGLQSQTGGSLTETLENIADTVRKRVAQAKRARALSAEARLTAQVLGVLPFLAALALYFIRPGYIETFVTTPQGNKLLAVAIGMLLTGIFVLRTIIQRVSSD